MKIIQLAVTEGELFALTDTGHVFRLRSLIGEAPGITEYQWQILPLPAQVTQLNSQSAANGPGEPCPSEE